MGARGEVKNGPAYLDLPIGHFDVVFGQRIEAWEVLNVPIGKVETGAMPGAGHHPIAQSAVDLHAIKEYHSASNLSHICYTFSNSLAMGKLVKKLIDLGQML
jgi:hypothetical protein